MSLFFCLFMQPAQLQPVAHSQIDHRSHISNHTIPAYSQHYNSVKVEDDHYVVRLVFIRDFSVVFLLILFSRQITPPITPPCNTRTQIKIIIWTGKLLLTLRKGSIFTDNQNCIFFFFHCSRCQPKNCYISLEYTLVVASYSNAISVVSLWIVYFGSRISASNFL